MIKCDSNQKRNLVIINQEANYLTIGLANAFCKKFDSVTLVVGVLYREGEELDPRVQIQSINRMYERPAWKKAFSYLWALIRIWLLLLTRFRGHEVLFVSVPPMGYLLNLVVPNRFSMVIWDLYPDAFKVTGMSESHWVYRLWAWANRRSFAKAFRLFTISEVLANALSRYVEQSKIIVLPIWSMFATDQRIENANNRFLSQYGLAEKFVVQYSGNIGITHNVELLLEVAEKMLEQPNIVFQIIGRGPRLPVIEKLVRQCGLRNVQLLPFQSSVMFQHSLSAASLGVVSLDERVSHGSVPSKAYNLMSFGIPSLYISAESSQLAEYARKFQHAANFGVHQVDEMVRFILLLANDPVEYRRMSQAARAAAANFTSDNARQFLDRYFSEVAH